MPRLQITGTSMITALITIMTKKATGTHTAR